MFSRRESAAFALSTATAIMRQYHIAHFFFYFFLFRNTQKFLHSLSSSHLSACALTVGWGCQESQSDVPAGDRALRSSLASCASLKWASVWKS